ncbi:hypothetical protein K469DRAFT_700180 [Zopfia rhizophila CBS 207.26]|uniref:Uncharacterized protein n=1 Tax=Zopfia rhizophila CBS 207.26 TaxID=1314779 RepID=A0A6A6DDF5_9PEZI|nr:hypothetical protein K469DRAFT_700180 [Zopfia rhizophila CBS 207.26]
MTLIFCYGPCLLESCIHIAKLILLQGFILPIFGLIIRDGYQWFWWFCTFPV